MTNQQDAYTLAAQAAADRARAEALQQGAAPAGPGIQSPTRRLSKNPAFRWVLSGVLLAAGTALAVDYINGPLGAWIKYHWAVPNTGGKSGAQVAVEESAAPQAKIEAEISAPAQAEARGKAMKKWADFALVHLSDKPLIAHRQYSGLLIADRSQIGKFIQGRSTDSLVNLDYLADLDHSRHLPVVDIEAGDSVYPYLQGDNITPDTPPDSPNVSGVLVEYKGRIIMMFKPEYKVLAAQTSADY